MKRNLNKQYGVALIIVLVLILLGIKYGNRNINQSKIANQQQYNPSPTTELTTVPTISVNTNNWLIYNNPGSHIRFKYPPSFTYNERSNGSLYGYPSILSTVHFSNTTTTIEFAASNNFSNYTSSEALGKGPFLNYSSDIVKKINISKVTIGGVEGIMARNVPVYMYRPISDVIITKDGLIYEFILGEDNKFENENIFKAILNSIEFN